MQLGWREVLSKPYHPGMELYENFFKIFFFECAPFLKSLLNLLQYHFCFLLFCPWGMWNLSTSCLWASLLREIVCLSGTGLEYIYFFKAPQEILIHNLRRTPLIWIILHKYYLPQLRFRYSMLPVSAVSWPETKNATLLWRLRPLRSHST